MINLYFWLILLFSFLPLFQHLVFSHASIIESLVSFFFPFFYRVVILSLNWYCDKLTRLLVDWFVIDMIGVVLYILPVRKALLDGVSVVARDDVVNQRWFPVLGSCRVAFVGSYIFWDCWLLVVYVCCYSKKPVLLTLLRDFWDWSGMDQVDAMGSIESNPVIIGIRLRVNPW